jgi:hypothetical protein
MNKLSGGVMELELGKLEPVSLRKVWKYEESDFTPWLAREENLQLLNETLGLELECEAIEKAIGGFKADILCKEGTSDNYALIENQLTPTDHNHLGQLLTYSAGIDVNYVIWIADKFKDEHRAAIDWLNEITGENYNFFAIEVELWRIGNSNIAPKFNIASKPNDWSKSLATLAKESANNAKTDTKKMQHQYWQEFMNYLSKSDTKIKTKKPLPQHWSVFSVGKTKCHLSTSINTRENVLQIRLNLRGIQAKERYAYLYENKDEIENEIGSLLQWEERPDNPMSLITLSKTGVDPTNREDWPQQFEWLKTQLEAFYKCFFRYLKEIE